MRDEDELDAAVIETQPPATECEREKDRLGDREAIGTDPINKDAIAAAQVMMGGDRIEFFLFVVVQLLFIAFLDNVYICLFP